MWVYILECADGSFYTGWTNDIVKRYKAHQKGQGAKYTRSHYPLRIVYLEHFEEKTDAMKREYQIKHMSRTQKQRLISSIEKENQTGHNKDRRKFTS